MRFLLLNQTFYPDVMATGQYLAEVAQALVARGHQVTVVTSRRAYDQPEKRFASRELWRGIEIYRVSSTGLGKGAKWRRAFDFGSFFLACCLRLAMLPRFDVVMALTSPPLISVLGACLAHLRSSKFVYWIMDFNPDEAIAAGWLRPNSLVARVLERMSLFSLRTASRIIALDRFMRERILAKGIAPEKVTVIPPWSHDSEVRFDPEGRERFRKAHGLEGKFVVMYSGNHSPCHPLDTLMAAADQFEGDHSIAFCFVGGGSEFNRVKQWAERQKSQVICLPYLPLSELSGSLSSADIHVVVMGVPFVGLIHPSKVYNVLAVGAPVLYIGPALSHISEIASSANGEFSCFSARHDDVDAVVKHLQLARAEAHEHSRNPSSFLRDHFSAQVLIPKLTAQLEST